MRTPAGLPCRVMMTSFSASLTWRERSSLTSESGTFFIRPFRTGRAMTLPPTWRRSEHLDGIACDVVEDANFADLRGSERTQDPSGAESAASPLAERPRAREASRSYRANRGNGAAVAALWASGASCTSGSAARRGRRPGCRWPPPLRRQTKSNRPRCRRGGGATLGCVVVVRAVNGDRSVCEIHIGLHQAEECTGFRSTEATVGCGYLER